MTLAWIAVGVVLIAVELHHLAFYALFASLGCFAGAARASAFRMPSPYRSPPRSSWPD